MPIEKTEAIILKSQKLGETSKILTLYTRRYGKLKMVAKGSRGTRSRFFGSLEPLNHVSIVFYRKENRQLQLLSQADIINSFSQTRSHLEKTGLAMAVCELVNQTQLDEAPNPRLFQLVLETLTALNRVSGKMVNYFYYFELKFLEIAGFKPKLDRCLICHRDGPIEKVIFNISRGGFICTRCHTQQTKGIVLSPEALQLLRRLQKTKCHKAGELETSRAAMVEANNLLSSFLKFHIEDSRDLNSLKVLKEMKKSLEANIMKKHGCAG